LRNATLLPSYQAMDASIVASRTDAASRLPADARIGRVRLRVSDIGRALELYRDVLGLEVTRDEGVRVTLAGSQGKSEIIVLEEQPGVARRPVRPVSTGLYHVALLVPSRRDLGRSLRRLRQAHYPLRGMSDHAVSESLYLDDPDGNGLEIYADRPRTEWPIEGGVVQMTVDPMDVEGVIAAGRERPEPWTGLPAETVVGHVHITVSQMERAVAFYRDVVGFDVMMRIRSLTAVSAGGYHHHLNLNTWAGEGAPPDSDRVAGLLGWELVVPGVQARRAVIDRLGAAGALSGAPGGATASDPDRIPLELEPVP
jgi:catechol 2,3-dioxygenase